ncbi:hypothetical protein [Kribbella sancticallisti]
MTVPKSKSVGIAIVAMLFAILPAASAGTSAAAAPQTTTTSSAVPSADSPSPTLGSTQSNADQPGDNDGDASDFSGTPLVIGGIALVVILLVAFTLFTFRGRRRRSEERGDQAGNKGRMKDRS